MFEIKMPQMGQSVEEASIVKWFKQEGDVVVKGEPLFSIQTDKAEVECEAPEGGVLRKILLAPDVIVPVLTLIGLIGEANEALPEAGGVSTPAAKAPDAPAPTAVQQPVTAPAAVVTPQPQAGGRVIASPRAKAQAASLNVDLGALAGTGPSGRVVEADVLAASGISGSAEVRITPTAKRVAQNMGVDVKGIQGTGIGGKITKIDVAGAGFSPVAAVPAAPVPGVGETIKLSPMRRVIAKRMCESLYSAPHYYVTVEVDMSAAKKFRAKLEAFTPSFNDLVLCATVKALRSFPQVNARWLGDAIEIMADVNLGVAVALPEGLIVPVLKKAQHLSLEGIREQCKVLIDKAKTGKLTPDDYTGNTFTISNLGPFGVDQFTAIINQPDSAILAVGQMKDRPVVVDGGIFIRPIMKLTLSSDHRVIDGSVAAQFMGRLKELLETAEF